MLGMTATDGQSAPGDTKYPTRVALEDALRIVATCAARQRLPAARIPLADALGCVAAEDLHAPGPLPPFDHSAMDGFAVRRADLPATGERSFELIGEAFAGADSVPTVGAGQCVRITTGAPIPPGADAAVMKERARVEGTRVSLRMEGPARDFVRVAGEDYAAGDPVLAAGDRLRSAQLAVLAAFGCAQVTARRRPRLAVIATGNELVPVDAKPGFGQIHASNDTMLAAMAREAGAQVVAQRCVRDDPDALRAALIDAAAAADVVVTSGGVSMGEADHMPGVLAAIGEIRFHKVRVKPGMPTLFGQIGACQCFGLPGNPAAAAVAFRVFVRFALRTLQGAGDAPAAGRARLAAPFEKRRDGAELVRCALTTDAEGVQWAAPHAKQGGAMLRGLADARALALLPEGARRYARGDVVTLWPD